MKERSQPVRCHGTGRFESAIIDHLLTDMAHPESLMAQIALVMTLGAAHLSNASPAE